MELQPDEDFPISGEFPPLSQEQKDMIVADLEANGHTDEANELLDWWNRARESRQERIYRYLGYMGHLLS